MPTVETAGRPGRPPGTRVTPEGFTDRQAAIINFIEREVARQGYPPSMPHIMRVRTSPSLLQVVIVRRVRAGEVGHGRVLLHLAA
ncbi:hypothetical protein ACFO9E_35065 [Streptomyces maoxianensis]|uniref:LexA repressor DNA-binding domain-containing protein n=1 Tax=Streptomyces maoxianensis TaxID=1459942 RepID=A0ABV9GF44_9ACTN